METDALAAERARAFAEWRSSGTGAAPDLSGIDLSGQDLRGVDFTAANLSGANLTGANLAGARFAWARLAHADLSGATGLIGSQFARADLTGIRLPPTVKFVAYHAAGEIAEGTSKLFLSVMLVCAYSWLTISSTLDSKLLTDTAVSKLPIVNADIPIVNFFTLAPIVLVGMALLLMLQAQRLWAALAETPAIMPDGSPMSDRAATWVLGAWAAERIAPPERRGVLARLQARLFVIIGWWLVPVTVAWFWGRYLHRHEWSGTLIQLAALTVGCVGAAGFLDLASVTLPRSPVKRERVRPPWLTRLRPYAPALASAIIVPLVFGTASYSGISGVHRGVSNIASAGSLSEQSADARPALALERGAPAVRALLPQLMSRVGVSPVAQLSETEVSTRLTATGTVDTAADAMASGARLVGADLRFASAERVFLALGDLRYADLLGANLRHADLRGANAIGADFTGSSLYGADMRKMRANAAPVVTRGTALGGADVADTLYCSRSSFAAANMRYARMDDGDFRGASFDAAMLQGASLARARLANASFVGADLDGADLRRTSGLTVDQVLQARHIDALYDDELLAKLRVRDPARFAYYDAESVEAEAVRRWLSGEDEPDTLSVEDRTSREALIRRAFSMGASSEPSTDALTQWAGRAKSAGTAVNLVPHGCIVARASIPLPRATPHK
ncbi:MAG: pentapeptide repeat-containing protein [Gemmatimonadaceae bacterium]